MLYFALVRGAWPAAVAALGWEGHWQGCGDTGWLYIAASRVEHQLANVVHELGNRLSGRTLLLS